MTKRLITFIYFQIKAPFRQNAELYKKIYLDFSQEDAITVKDIEKETNHDVKAVEYFIKKKFKDLQLEEWRSKTSHLLAGTSDKTEIASL